MTSPVTGVKTPAIGAAPHTKFHIGDRRLYCAFCQLLLHSANTEFLVAASRGNSRPSYSKTNAHNRPFANGCIRCKRLGFKKQESVDCVI